MAENETTTPVVEADTTAQKPTEAPKPEPRADETISLSSAALSARLERERVKILKELGVEKVDDARNAIAEYRKRVDAEKTETERMRAEIQSLSEKAKRVEYLDSVVSIRAKSELSGLTDAQREAVIAVAGDDAGAQLKAVELLRPTWAQAQQPAEQPKPVPKQAPANTTSARPAPKPGNAETESVVAKYERLRRSDPMYAAQFRLANLERYTEEIKSRE